MFFDKKINKHGYVFFSLPERREFDGNNVESVIKVLPEILFNNGFFKDPVGSGNYPHIDIAGTGSPTREKSPSCSTLSSFT